MVGRRAIHEVSAAFGSGWIGKPTDGIADVGLPFKRMMGGVGEKIGDAKKTDARRISIRLKGESGEGGVSAIGATEDGDALRFDNPFSDEVIDAVGDVGLHDTGSPLAVAGIHEGFAVAARSSEVWLEDGVATIGEELDTAIESGFGPHTGASVWKDDERPWCMAVVWEGEKRGDGMAVACQIGQRAGFAHAGWIGAWAFLPELGRRSVKGIVEEDGSGIAGGVGFEEDTLLRIIDAEKLHVVVFREAFDRFQ